MKKIILVTLLSGCFFVSFSQINKGQWLIGGNAFFNYDEDKVADDLTIKTSNVRVTPNAGYFIFDNFAAGLHTGFSNNVQKFETNSGFYYVKETTSKQAFGGVFLRYYFLPASSAVNIVIDGAYTYGFNKESITLVSFPFDRTSTTIVKTNNLLLTAGPVFFLNPHTALEVLVSFGRTDYINSESKAITFLIGAGLQVHLGKEKSEIKAKK